MGHEPVGYRLEYSCVERLPSIFLKTLCIFFSVVSVGSMLSSLNCLVFNTAKHFSLYFDLYKIATPLLLSCFIITISAGLAGIIMSKLETKVVPTVSNYLANWKRFVDDTIGYVKTNKVEFVLQKLNSF